jgi:hypothetical protein
VRCVPLVVSLLVAIAPVVAGGGDAAMDGLGRGEVVLERAAIRARGRDHGEILLVRSGEVVVLQTSIATRTLRRVAARISAAEIENWPDGEPGALESKRYRDALDLAVESVLAQEREGRERRLEIEMRLGPGRGAIVFRVPSGPEPTVGEPSRPGELRRLELPCSWVRSEIERVAADRGVPLDRVRPLPECVSSGLRGGPG